MKISNLVTCGRRILGPSLFNFVRNTIVDLAFSLKLVPPANELNKPDGISALVRVRNEEWWIEPSLLSIKDLVEEYVVIDSSTDNTTKIVEEVKREHDLNITHIIDFGEDIVKLSNKALKNTKFRWVLRWDGDFVASEEMTPAIKNLIGGFDNRKNYVVYWPHICLDGDLFHQKAPALHVEHWLWSYTPKATFIKIPREYEYLNIPFYIVKRIRIDKPLSFHLRTVKPPERILVGKYWGELLKNDLEGKVNLEQYVKKRIHEEYHVNSIEEAAKINLKGLFKGLSSYDKEKFCDYPPILKEYAKKKFGLIL